MSVWPYLLGREYVQNLAITDLNERLRVSEVHDKYARRRESASRDARFTAIEQEVGELALFVRTLYRLALEKGSITPREFAEAAKAVDQSDGVEDGRFTPKKDA